MKLNKKLAKELCERLIKSDGACTGRSCMECPGQRANNNKKFCTENGWRKSDFRSKDKQTVQSARQWLLMYDKPLTNIYEEE
jgi:hypothetical protein